MKEEIIGEAGGIPGLVRIIADHVGQVRRVEIDDLVFQKTDKGLISDLFVAALNNLNDQLRLKALEKIRKRTKPTLLDALGLGSADVIELPPLELPPGDEGDE